MALAAIKTWGSEVLFAADLNAEFANIRNNANALISPFTADVAAGGFKLTGLGLGSVGAPSLSPTGAASTGIYFGSASRIDFSNAGVRAGGFNTGRLIMGSGSATTGSNAGDIIVTGTNMYRFLNQAGTSSANYGVLGVVGNNLEYYVPDGGSTHSFFASTFKIVEFGTLGDGTGGYMLFNGEASTPPTVAAGKGALYLHDNAGTTQLRFRDDSAIYSVDLTAV